MNAQPEETETARTRHAGLHDGLHDGAVSAAHGTDAELVRACLAGDEEAFRALVARYHKRAFWAAFHIVGRVEEARDVVQEAFVRVHRSLSRYDPARSFYTWFYRIVMNLAIDQLRRLRSAAATSLDALACSLPDPRQEGAAEAVAMQREQDARVRQALDGLEPHFRSVLVLRDLEGLSCREIAPILGLSHATTRWRLHRARLLFKEKWERLCAREGR